MSLPFRLFRTNDKKLPREADFDFYNAKRCFISQFIFNIESCILQQKSPTDKAKAHIQ